MIEASAVFGRRWFLALALRQVPAPDDPAPDAPAPTETDTKETEQCAS
jgi:hypothetical protein